MHAVAPGSPRSRRPPRMPAWRSRPTASTRAMRWAGCRAAVGRAGQGDHRPGRRAPTAFCS